MDKLGRLLLPLAVLVAGPALADEPLVIAGSGNITPFLEEYRALLGDNLGNGPAARKGRREINWDGISDEAAAPEFLPDDIFIRRGVLLTTPGDGVQASARAGYEGLLPNFGHINETYAETFRPFSAERLFSPVGSNAVDVHFVVSGTDEPGLVHGFGAVYVDVDEPHTAFEFFDADDASLGRFEVPANDGGFSFLGVYFDEPIVARVRIDYGTEALGPDDEPGYDVAVMDDFLYDEPQPLRRRGSY